MLSIFPDSLLLSYKFVSGCNSAMQRVLRQKCIEIVRANDRLLGQARRFNIQLDLIRASFERSIPRKVEIRPFEILQVNPKDIKVMNKESFHDLDFLLLSPVLGGDWDHNVRLLHEYDLYASLLSHFKDGKEWRETEFYSRVRDELEADESSSKWGCSDFQEFRNRLDLLDELYRKIQNEGYKTQRQLREDGVNLFSRSHSTVPERHEVEVDVARNREFIFVDGVHRLTIAKLLDIPTIPVRVRLRHRKWQNKRYKVKKGLMAEAEYMNHPDIENIR